MRGRDWYSLGFEHGLEAGRADVRPLVIQVPDEVDGRPLDKALVHTLIRWGTGHVVRWYESEMRAAFADCPWWVQKRLEDVASRMKETRER